MFRQRCQNRNYIHISLSLYLPKMQNRLSARTQVYAPIGLPSRDSFTTQAKKITNTCSVVLRSLTLEVDKSEWETPIWNDSCFYRIVSSRSRRPGTHGAAWRGGSASAAPARPPAPRRLARTRPPPATPPWGHGEQGEAPVRATGGRGPARGPVRTTPRVVLIPWGP